MSLTLTPLSKIPLIQPGDDLAQVILTALQTDDLDLQHGDILVLAQKIVSKAENRIVNLTNVTPSPEAVKYAGLTEKDPRLIELILGESSAVLRTRPGLIIVEHRLGFVCANAGIDHSNVQAGDGAGNPENWVLLLPEEPDTSARKLQTNLAEQTGANIGVLIIDSHGRAWRMGTVGVCIGVAGVPALVDKRGAKDLFGYELRVTEIGAADELAAAASLVMGQVAEGTPVVHVRGFPYQLRVSGLNELIRPKEKDLFR